MIFGWIAIAPIAVFAFGISWKFALGWLVFCLLCDLFVLFIEDMP